MDILVARAPHTAQLASSEPAPNQAREQAVNPSKRIFPLNLLGYVAVAALVLVLGLNLIVPSTSAKPVDVTQEAIAARLAPVARLEFAAPAPAAHVAKTGDAVYSGLCIACHGSGAAGAPKLGDKAAWGGRIAQGFDTLVKHATEGYKGMPPRGGGADLDNQEIARAVAWMANKGGASFKEP